MSNASLRLRIRQNASLKEKTLIRLVADTLKKLVHFYQVKSCEDIFLCFEVQTFRYKLKECLNKLMFLEPLEFGQKAEDTIWKSIFYEPIRLFKKKIKSESIQTSGVNNKSLLCVGFKRHISAAIGYYQKLVLRLVTEYGLTNVVGICDQQLQQQLVDSEDGRDNKVSTEVRCWAAKCVERSLLYIGDLYRYEQEIRSLHSRSLAVSYYRAVLRLEPGLGHAYNQLATSDTTAYYGLTAAFFYLAAQLAPRPFLQSRDNFVILCERNVKRLRSVYNKEALLRKSSAGHIRRANYKILRVKSVIIKYINVLYSFLTAYELSQYEAQQLAAMCDDVLNSLSPVLGFDRKLVSTVECGASTNNPHTTGLRPVALNCEVVTHLLFTAFAVLENLKPVRDTKRESYETSADQRVIFDLCHSFLLNLFGHVLNQCLVRVRDEMRARGLDAALLFSRQDDAAAAAASASASAVSVNEEVPSESTKDEYQTEDDKSAGKRDSGSNNKKKRRKVCLARRLQRPRHGGVHSSEEDLSEERHSSDSDPEGVWDDLESEEESEEGNGEGEVGFEFSDEDEYGGMIYEEVESSEEIHSQDEDDQIIRAIVGQNTVFGRQPSADKEQAKTKSKDKVLILTGADSLGDEQEDDVAPESHNTSKKSKSKSQMTKSRPSDPQCHSQGQPDTLLQCIASVDLLQAIVVLRHYLLYLCSLSTDSDNVTSFKAVWPTAPFLWKHMAVVLNFCENVLDDLDKGTQPSGACEHIHAGNVRLTPATSLLPEASHICVSQAMQSPHKHQPDQLEEHSQSPEVAPVAADGTSVACANPLHIVITRLQQLLESCTLLTEQHALLQTPLSRQKTNASTGSSLWLVSSSSPHCIGGCGPRGSLIATCLSQLRPPLPTAVSAAPTMASTIQEEPVESLVTEQHKEKFMRQMARLRLENEFQSHPESIAMEEGGDSASLGADGQTIAITAASVDGDSFTGEQPLLQSSFSLPVEEVPGVYLVPDTEYMCRRWEVVRGLARHGRHVFVLTRSVLAALDRRKGSDHAARRASKMLEDELTAGNKHIRVESGADRPLLQSMPPSCEPVPIDDWSNIEPSVLRLARDAGVTGALTNQRLVVTVLTQAASQLPDSVMRHYAALGVDFRANFEI